MYFSNIVYLPVCKLSVVPYITLPNMEGVICTVYYACIWTYSIRTYTGYYTNFLYPILTVISIVLSIYTHTVIILCDVASCCVWAVIVLID